MDDRRRTGGVFGEAAACGFLEKQGVRILRKNYRRRGGEIDLIGREGRVWLAVEVKMRRRARQGEAAGAVNRAKQARICHTFDRFRMEQGLDDYAPVRFDVVEVNEKGDCRWIRNAFEYIEG